MGQATFYFVKNGERKKLKAFTDYGAQIEALNLIYSKNDLERDGFLIVTTLAPPVFYDHSTDKEFNIGSLGDQVTRREEWILTGEPYILCV